MGAAFIRVAEQDVTPGSAGSYVDCDVSSYIGGDAVGVWLSLHPTSNTASYDVRSNGSTSTLYYGSYGSRAVWSLFTGVDASGIFEAKISSTSYFTINLLGYADDPVTMFTNRVQHDPSGTGSYVDTDVSSDCPDGVMCLLSIIHDDSAGYTFTRKNGSSDDRFLTAGSVSYGRNRGKLVGLDGSQIFEQKASESYTETYVEGYYDGENVTMNTNAANRSLGTLAAWTDLTAASADAKAAFYEILSSSLLNGGIRKNGTADDPYWDVYSKTARYAIVETDDSGVVEGKIEGYAVDFYELGWGEQEPDTDKSLSGVVDVTGTIGRTIFKELSATVDVTGGIDRTIGKGLDTAIDTTAEISNRDIAKGISGVVDAVPEISGRSITKALIGTVDVTGTIARVITYVKALLGIVDATGSLNRSTSKQLEGTADVSGTLNRTISKQLAGVVDATGTIGRTISKVLTVATVNVTGSLAWQFIEELIGGVVVTGAINRVIKKQLSGQVDVTATVNRTIAKAFAAAVVNVTGLVQRATEGILAGGVVVTGEINKLIKKTISATVDVTGTMARNAYDMAYEMNKTVRQILAKVIVTYTDPYFAAGIETSATEEGRLTDPAETVDNVGTTPFKWFSLHRNDLTGAYHPMPSGGEYSVGWWGETLSDAVTGNITPGTCVLTVETTERTVEDLLVYGDNKLNEYPVDFTIKVYSTGDVLEHTEIVTGNSDVEWEKSITAVDDVVKLTLDISKWSRPEAVVKIVQFFTALEETYLSENGDLVSINVLEEREHSGATIPQGNISSSSLSVRFNNIDDKFSAGNPQSPLYNLLLNNRAVRAYLGCDLRSGERIWFPLGTFYSRDWNAPEGEIYAEMNALDALDRLQQTEFSTSEVYEDKTISELAVIVMTDAGLTAADWEIDSDLGEAAYEIPYAWFDRMSHREALKRLAAACLGQCYCDRDGKIVLEVYTAPSSQPYDFEYGQHNVFAVDHPLAWSEMINHVQAQAQPRVPSAEQDICIDTEEFTVPGSSSVTKTHFFDLSPCVDVVDPLVFVNAGGHVSLDSMTIYSWGVSAIYSNSDPGDETVTSVTIRGKPLEVQGSRIVTAEDTDSIASNGKQSLSEPLSSEFWQTEARAQTAADAVLATYKDPRRDVVMVARGNIAQLLGDRIAAPDYRGEVSSDYAIMRQDINWDGGLEIEVTAQAISDAPRTYLESIEGVADVTGTVGRTIKKTLSGLVVASGSLDFDRFDIKADGGGYFTGFHASTYSIARDLAVANGVELYDDWAMSIGQYWTTSYHVIWRCGLHIPTGDLIGAGDTIIEASLFVFLVGKFTSAREFDIVVQSGQPTYPHDPMVAADFDRTFYSGDGGSVNTAGVSSGWLEIPLNATGIAMIQKGAGAYTKLMLRSDADVNGIQTTPINTYEYGTLYLLHSESTKPYLRVLVG